mgnify:CR=1 FL=1
MDWEGLKEAARLATRTYEYDALGRRISEPERLLYWSADGNVIEDRTSSSVVQYVWSGIGGNHLVLRDVDSGGSRSTTYDSRLPAGIDQRIYAVADAAGNITTITGWDGSPVERYLYTPEGRLEVRTGDMSTALTSSACGWGYTYRSGRRDGEHLYYVGGKVYDYRTAGTLEPEPYQVWGIKPSMTPPAMSWYGKETSVFWSTFASELGHSARVAGRGMWNGVKQLGFMAADIVNDAVYVATYDRARLLWGDDAGGFRLYRGSLSSWGQAYDTGQLSFWDNQAHYRLVGEMLANSVTLGIYDQVKASVQLATDRIGWDEWTERMAVGGAFQMAVAPGLRGAPRAALRPAYTTEVVLPARGWRGFGEINSFGRNATFVANTSTGVSMMSLSAAGRFGCYIGVRAALAEDLVGVGRLGGQLYHARRLGVLRRYLERRGFSLSMDDAILDALNANGGFSARSRTIYLRSDATRYEVWHELSHFLHSRRIGSEAYLALQRPIRPEAYVYDSLRSSRHWHLLNSAEQRHASAYIMKVGGMAW